MNNLARNLVAHSFGQAAPNYDRAASVQARVARYLVEKVSNRNPNSILDIGCGTGFVADAAARRWPQAHITAVDAAPAMLKEAQRKVPRMHGILGDIVEKHFGSEFDLIFSSMALHWLPQRREVLEKWRRWLTPKGGLYVATLVEGSFREWRQLCADANLVDGLQIFPSEHFADDLTTEQEIITVEYPTAKDFLRRIKTTGAALSRVGHKPFDITCMRALLAQAPQPFTVSYHVLYIEMQSLGSI